MSESACTRCGACCSSLRVDFSVHEMDTNGGQVPTGLCESLNDHMARMRGTDHSPPRCAALSGQVGGQVRCGIYEWRPSPCQEFEEGSAACAQARRRHGLTPLDSTH